MKSINSGRSQKLSGFFDYLTQPGQMPGEDMPPVYTNIEDSTAAGIKSFMDRYEKNFKNAVKEKRLRHNSKLLAKSMVFVLPHEMTKAEIDGYVAAVVKALPEGMTYAFALHRGSHKKTADSWKNLHLQGFLGVRGDGAGKFGADIRIPLHDDLIKASDAYIKSLGFKIRYDPTSTLLSKKNLSFLEAEAMTAALKEGVTGNREVKSRQSELLRNPMWLLDFSNRDDIKSEQLKKFCRELAMKRIRVDAEKFAANAGSYGPKFVKQLTGTLAKETEVRQAEPQTALEVPAPQPSKMVTVKLPMPARLRPDRMTFSDYAEQKRLERLEGQQQPEAVPLPPPAVPERILSLRLPIAKPSQPLTPEKLKSAIDSAKPIAKLTTKRKL